MSRRSSPRRQIFVLTPDEKKAVCCIIGAFLLGLVTMHYRAKHPRTPPPSEQVEQQTKKKATPARPASRRSPRPQSAAAQEEDE